MQSPYFTRIFDIAGFLLRFLGSLLSLPAEDLAVFSFFPRNNYIIAYLYEKTIDYLAKFFPKYDIAGRRELAEVNSRNRDEGSGY